MEGKLRGVEKPDLEVKKDGNSSQSSLKGKKERQ